MIGEFPLLIYVCRVTYKLNNFHGQQIPGFNLGIHHKTLNHLKRVYTNVTKTGNDLVANLYISWTAMHQRWDLLALCWKSYVIYKWQCVFFMDFLRSCILLFKHSDCRISQKWTLWLLKSEWHVTKRHSAQKTSSFSWTEATHFTDDLTD